MTARQLAEVCGEITMKLMMGGVPQELAMLGVKVKLMESMQSHADMEDKEARRDVVATELKEEFAFCLQG